jgi:hypothetical protein
MRVAWLVMAVLVGIGLGAFGVATSRAQQPAPPPKVTFSVQTKGAQKSLTDVVRGAVLEYDPPKQLDLLIVGSKGRGQFTCEVRSASRELLVAIQRTILEAPDVSVSCVNGAPSNRGGVIVDLDDKNNGGSFVLSANRP